VYKAWEQGYIYYVEPDVVHPPTLCMVCNTSQAHIILYRKVTECKFIMH